MSRNNRIITFIIFIFCYILIISRVINVSIYDETRARNGLLGDGFSDKNTVSSAKYFLDSGFNKTFWLPVHDYYPEGNISPQVYTHYPALPNILAGITATILQTYNESALRILPVLLSVILFMLIYFVMKQMIKNEQKALIGSTLLWLANYFINYADNLHQHLYGELLKWIYIYLLYKYYNGAGKKNIITFILCIIMMLEVNISFEQPVFLGVLTLGFSIIYKQGVFSANTVLAGISVIAGFVMHLWQNALYLGSWDAAINDLVQAYTFRATGSETVGYVKEMEFSWKQAWQIPFDWFNRMERFYLLPGWFLLFISFFGLRSMRYENKQLLKITWVAFIAAAAWSLVMAQHAFVHAFTNKHFALWVALVGAYSLPVYMNKVVADFKLKQNLNIKALHIVLIGYAAVMMFSQQVYEVWLKFALFYPHLGK